jgi:2-alkenal reductase
MNHPSNLISFLVSLGAIALVLIIGIAFSAGVALAPRVNDLRSPAAVATTEIATQPLRQSATETKTSSVAALEQTLMNIYQNTVPAVVNIWTTQKVEPLSLNQFDFSFPPAPFTPWAGRPQVPEDFQQYSQASGFVWDNEGHIVTNYHVVVDATDIAVNFADGRSLRAEVIGTDPDAELAVLKVDLTVDELHPLPLGDSDLLRPGQLAIAIGNPFGQEFTMTSGIISAVGRTIRGSNSSYSIPEVIQADVAINPGNSGGPLLNSRGEVIGINTLIISRSGANAGIGFATPINTARRIVPILIKDGKIEYAWLGITGVTLTTQVAESMSLPARTQGALVIEVGQDSPAAAAGLQGCDKSLTVAGHEYHLGGDVIVGIDDQPVQEMADLTAYLSEGCHPGDEVSLDIIRFSGEHGRITVTLGVRPRPDNADPENG